MIPVHSPLIQQQIQSSTNSKDSVTQQRNQNSLFAHNSAPSSHHTTNGKISSMAGLKQIVNPQPLLQNAATRKGSAVTNSQHSSEMKALNMNFSQGSIPTNSAQQAIQFHNFQAHPYNQRSFSNSKLPQYKGSKNTVLEQPIKSNFSPEEALNNCAPYFSVASNNQNIGSASCHINEIVYNHKNSISPPKQAGNNSHQIANNQQPYHQIETPFTIFKQNYMKQKMATSTVPNFPYSTSNAQIMNSSANSSKNSLNIKRLKHSNGNQSTPNQAASPSPNHHAHFGPYHGLDKQCHLQSIERIKENINKKLVLQQPLSVGSQNSAASNVVSNVFKQNKAGTSNSEHKMNIGSDRNQQNIASVNQNILLSINQSQSIRRKMNNNSASTNINYIINNNQSAFLPSKNLQNGQGETMSLNITQNSPNLNNFYVSNSTKNNNNFQSINLNNSGSFSNNNSNNFKEEQQQNNTSTNIIFEKVKKRKMNNLSLGGQQQNLYQNQQQQLQNLIQSRSSQLHTPTTNSKDQFLSKTLSFSGHQNHFYSPNTYTKHQPNQQENNNPQNNTVGAIQSKLKQPKQADPQNNHHNNNNTFNTSNNHNYLSSHSAQKPVSSPQQTSDGMSSGNNTNIREAQEKKAQKSNKEIILVNVASSQPPLEFPINILNLNSNNTNNNNNLHLNSNGGGSSQSDTQENGNQIPRPFNKFSQSLLNKQNQGEAGFPKKDIFSPSHKGTCKLIMNKLDQFNIQNSENSIEHIIEIVSLLHLSMVDTPFDAVLGKFEENIAKVNIELRAREKQNQQKVGNKQNEIDILQREITSINAKIEKLNHQNFKKKTPQKVSQVTQTTPKKKKQQSDKNAVIQICDQNGNVQEVDTDKENDMLRDYILEQEKKVNVFKDKEGKMIKLLLAIKKRGVDIDDIYNAEIVNEESTDEVVKVNPLSSQFQLGEKKTKVDNNFFKKLDNDQAYADNSIVNDSDESSFGFYGKPSARDQSIIIKQKSFKPKQIVKNKVVKQLESKLKLNLADLNNKNSEDDDDEGNDEEKENRLFHKKILQTLNITQDELDKLQQQIQNDPSNLSNEQLYLVQQIHALQQEHEKQLKLKNKLQNKQQQDTSYSGGDKDQILLNINDDSPDSRRIIISENILPSETQNQINTISLGSYLEGQTPNNIKSYQNQMNFDDEDGDDDDDGSRGDGEDNNNEEEDYEDNNNSSLNGSSRDQFYYLPK